ncbi:MAG: CopD family protein [Alphaproteobacteria bacterium]
MTTLIPWLKSLHIAALVVWAACLFVLPALYAGFPALADAGATRRLRAMARFTFIAIASPAAVIAIAAGTLLIHPTASYEGWLVLKLGLVLLMVLFHVVCGRLVVVLHHRPDIWSVGTHLWLTAVPALLVPPILYLVLAKPL